MTYGRKIWLNSPDTEKIRLKLIDFLDRISNDIEQCYPSDTNIEEEVMSLRGASPAGAVGHGDK
jgi:hypothetical protein